VIKPSAEHNVAIIVIPIGEVKLFETSVEPAEIPFNNACVVELVGDQEIVEDGV
jgi:hypothetical protein